MLFSFKFKELLSKLRGNFKKLYSTLNNPHRKNKERKESSHQFCGTGYVKTTEYTRGELTATTAIGIQKEQPEGFCFMATDSHPPPVSTRSRKYR